MAINPVTGTRIQRGSQPAATVPVTSTPPTQAAPREYFFDELSKGLNLGGAQVVHGVQGAIAAGQAALGYEDEARARLEQSRQERDLVAAQNAPRVGRVEDIRTDDMGTFLSDLNAYMQQLIGSQAPIMAAMAAGGVVGGGVGGLAARAGIGALAGAGAASAGFETGQIFSDIAADPEAEGSLREKALISGAGGTLAGSLDILPLFGAARRLGVPNPLGRSLVARAARAALPQAGSEALTEGAQTIVERGTHAFVNKNFEVLGEEGVSEVLNSMVAGGILGGGIGAITGALQRPGPTEEDLVGEIEAEEVSNRLLLEKRVERLRGTGTLSDVEASDYLSRPVVDDELLDELDARTPVTIYDARTRDSLGLSGFTESALKAMTPEQRVAIHRRARQQDYLRILGRVAEQNPSQVYRMVAEKVRAGEEVSRAEADIAVESLINEVMEGGETFRQAEKWIHYNEQVVLDLFKKRIKDTPYGSPEEDVAKAELTTIEDVLRSKDSIFGTPDEEYRYADIDPEALQSPNRVRDITPSLRGNAGSLGTFLDQSGINDVEGEGSENFNTGVGVATGQRGRYESQGRSQYYMDPEKILRWADEGRTTLTEKSRANLPNQTREATIKKLAAQNPGTKFVAVDAWQDVVERANNPNNYDTVPDETDIQQFILEEAKKQAFARGVELDPLQPHKVFEGEFAIRSEGTPDEVTGRDPLSFVADDLLNTGLTQQQRAERARAKVDKERAKFTRPWGSDIFPRANKYITLTLGTIDETVKRPRPDGTFPAAFRRPDEETQGRTSTVYIDMERIEAEFKNKEWTNPKIPGVTPLEDDQFQTPEEYARFLLAHEKAHVLNDQYEQESRSQYENRINRLALQELEQLAQRDIETSGKFEALRTRIIREALKVKTGEKDAEGKNIYKPAARTFKGQFTTREAASLNRSENLRPQVAEDTRPTPITDALPRWQPGQRTMRYAGIGSRQTPPDIFREMQKLSEEFRDAGYTLYTGEADGADRAFRFNARDKKRVFTAKNATEETRALALEIHPNPDALTRNDYVWNLMARNAYQILGENLDSPVDFVLTWTPDGAQSRAERTQATGGTGQAIDLASRLNVPIINMALRGWRERLNQVLSGEQVGAFSSVTQRPASTTAEVPFQSMMYEMPVEALRPDLVELFPDGTTTLDLVRRGIRTATTRGRFAEPGQTISFRGDDRMYLVTDVQPINADRLKNDPGYREAWEGKEGWNLDYVLKDEKLAEQVLGGYQTTFTPILVKPVANQDLAKEFLIRVHDEARNLKDASVADLSTILREADTSRDWRDGKNLEELEALSEKMTMDEKRKAMHAVEKLNAEAVSPALVQLARVLTKEDLPSKVFAPVVIDKDSTIDLCLQTSRMIARYLREAGLPSWRVHMSTNVKKADGTFYSHTADHYATAVVLKGKIYIIDQPQSEFGHLDQGRTYLTPTAPYQPRLIHESEVEKLYGPQSKNINSVYVDLPNDDNIRATPSANFPPISLKEVAEAAQKPLKTQASYRGVNASFLTKVFLRRRRQMAARLGTMDRNQTSAESTGKFDSFEVSASEAVEAFLAGMSALHDVKRPDGSYILVQQSKQLSGPTVRRVGAERNWMSPEDLMASDSSLEAFPRSVNMGEPPANLVLLTDTSGYPLLTWGEAKKRIQAENNRRSIRDDLVLQREQDRLEQIESREPEDVTADRHPVFDRARLAEEQERQSGGEGINVGKKSGLDEFYARVEARKATEQAKKLGLPSAAQVATQTARKERINAAVDAALSKFATLDQKQAANEWARLGGRSKRWRDALKRIGSFRLANTVNMINILAKRGDVARLQAMTDGRLLGVTVGDTVWVSPYIDIDAQFEILAHEMGHVLAHNTAPKDVGGVYDAFIKWRKDVLKKDNPTNPTEARRTLKTIIQSFGTTPEYDFATMSDADLEYITDFEEWFADQVAAWLMSPAAEPKGAAQGWASRFVEKMSQLFTSAKADDVNIEPTVEQFIENVIKSDAYAAVRVYRATIRDARAPAAIVVNNPTTQYAHHAVLALIERGWLSGKAANALARTFHSNSVINKRIQDILRPHSPAEAARVETDWRRAVAYGYQLWAGGALELGPSTQGFFDRLSDWFVSTVVGEVSDIKQAEFIAAQVRNEVAKLASVEPHPDTAQIMAAMTSNPLAGQRSAFVVSQALRNTRLRRILQDQRWIWDNWLTRLVTKLASPAHRRMLATKNAALIEIARRFMVAVGTEGRGESYLQARSGEIGRWQTRFANALGGSKLTKDQANQILTAMQQNTPAADPEIAAIVQRLRDVFEDMYNYAEEAGLDIKRRKNYFPWVYDIEALIQRKDEWIRLMTSPEYSGVMQSIFDQMRTTTVPTNGGGTVSYADLYHINSIDDLAEYYHIQLVGDAGYADLGAIASPIAQKILADRAQRDERVYQQAQSARNGIRMDKTGHTPFMAALNERGLNFLQELGSPDTKALHQSFLSQDLNQILRAYTEQVVKRAEYNRRFKIDRITGDSELGQLMEDARNLGASHEDLRVAHNFVDAMQGTLGYRTNEILQNLIGKTPPKGEVINPKLQAGMGALILWQNMRTLALAALTSLADPVGILVRGEGLDVAWASLKAAGAEIRKTGAHSHEVAEALGVINSYAVDEVLASTYGTNYMTGATRLWSERFFHWNQLERLTRVTRAAATGGALQFLKKHRASTSEKSQRFLDELGVTRDDLKLNANGEVMVLTDAEIKTLVEQNTEDARAELARDRRVRGAIRRFVDESILRPNAATRPIWASDPHFQLVFHLKSFMFTFHDVILRRVFREVFQHGNAIPAIQLLWFVPIALFADYLREIAKNGFEENPRRAGWTSSDYLWNAFERSGLLGLGQVFTDSAQDRQFGGLGIESLAGPLGGSLRDVDNILFGPNKWEAIVKQLPAQNTWPVREALL